MANMGSVCRTCAVKYLDVIFANIRDISELMAIAAEYGRWLTSTNIACNMSQIKRLIWSEYHSEGETPYF